MTDINFLWYAARGAGIVSMLLLTAVMLLGLMTSGRWQARDWPRFVTTDLHRNVSLLALVFLGVHIVTAIVDPYTSLGLLAALVPFAVAYKQFWLGLGVIALDLTVALIVTSLIRGRIGVRTWRLIHWAAYGAWPIAMLHGLGTGTDASALWMQAIVIGCTALIAGAIAWRALVEPPEPRAAGVRPPLGVTPRDGAPAGAVPPWVMQRGAPPQHRVPAEAQHPAWARPADLVPQPISVSAATAPIPPDRPQPHYGDSVRSPGARPRG